MLHWRHTTLDILFVLPQNHGSWKFENGYLCMFLVRTVSDYTCLSQACSEEGKAHTSIAFVPRMSHVIISLQVLDTAESGDS